MLACRVVFWRGGGWLVPVAVLAVVAPIVVFAQLHDVPPTGAAYGGTADYTRELLDQWRVAS